MVMTSEQVQSQMGLGETRVGAVEHMDVYALLSQRLENVLASVVGGYLMTSDSAHLCDRLRPSERPDHATAHALYWRAADKTRTYYAEILAATVPGTPMDYRPRTPVAAIPTQPGTVSRDNLVWRVWYNEQGDAEAATLTASPPPSARAPPSSSSSSSSSLSPTSGGIAPVCWLGTGRVGVPHRIGQPAWGTNYYVDGYRMPDHVGSALGLGSASLFQLSARNGVLDFDRAGSIYMMYDKKRLRVITAQTFGCSLSEFLRRNQLVWAPSLLPEPIATCVHPQLALTRHLKSSPPPTT